MPGLYGLPDPLDDLLGPLGLGRSRRPAAYPALPPAEAESLVGSLTDAGLSGLGYVGSVLDKTFGGRAVRGLLGGRYDELASIVPFSDSAGLTDPSRAVSGEDLLRQHLGYDPSRGNWLERNLAGPLAEAALDPGTYLTLGGKTAAGLAAKKAGTLTRGLGPGIRAGEKALATFAGVPLPGATGEWAAKVGTGLDRAGEAIKYAPGVRDLRSLLDHSAGPVADPVVQRANEFGKLPELDRLSAEARGLHEGLAQRVRPVIEAGADPQAASDYLRGRALGLPEGTLDRLVPGRAALAPHLGVLDPVADELRRYSSGLLGAEQAAGVGTKLLGDDFLDYFLRRALPAPAVPGARGAVQSFPTRGGSNLARKAVLRDIPGGDLQLERWIGDPTLRGGDPKAAAARIEQDLLAGLGEAVAGTHEPHYHPDYLDKVVPRKARALRKFVDQTDPRHATEGLPFFNQDNLGDLEARGLRSAQVRSNATALYHVIGTATRSVGPGRTPVLDVLRSGRLGGTKAANRAAVENALRAVGEDPGVIAAGAKPGTELAVLKRALAPYSLPEATARDATKPLQRFAAPEEVRPLLGAYDKLLGWWKDALYTVWPASHVRNLTSGVAENALATGTGPGAIFEAGRLRKGDAFDLRIPGLAGTPQEQRLALQREAYAQGVLKRGQGQFGADRLRQPTTLAEGLQASPSRPRTFATGDVPDAIRHPLRSGQEAGQAVEDNLRLGQFVDLRRKGFTPEAAAKEVEATHFDYGKLSDTEKSVMKRLVPFYTFSRRNLPKQVRRAVTEPGKAAVPIRLGTAAGKDDGEYVPEYLRSGFAIPAGEGPDGTTRFLTKLGLPVEEAFGGLKLGAGPLDTLGRTLESAAGSATPPLKLALESLTGRQSFTGRKLSDLRPTAAGSLLGLLDDDDPRARALTQLIGNSPLSRAASTLDKAIDERKPASLRALNLLTGARVSDVDTDRYRAIDARNALERMLAGVPGVSEYTRKYVRPEDRGKITPAVKLYVRLQQNLAEQAKAAAKERRQQAR